MGIRADEMVALHIAEGREHLNAKELEKAHESYTKAYEAIFSLKEAKQQELKNKKELIDDTAEIFPFRFVINKCSGKLW